MLTWPFANHVAACQGRNVIDNIAIHPFFPASPYAVLSLDQRRFPTAEDLRSVWYEETLAPLLPRLVSRSLLGGTRPIRVPRIPRVLATSLTKYQTS
jgi:hypothetical protein